MRGARHTHTHIAFPFQIDLHAGYIDRSRVGKGVCPWQFVHSRHMRDNCATLREAASEALQPSTFVLYAD
jgi:hypothetical protein